MAGADPRRPPPGTVTGAGPGRTQREPDESLLPTERRLPALRPTPPRTRRSPDGGARLGRYVLGRPLGSGGAARVFHGWDPSRSQAVALKVLDKSAEAGWTDRTAFDNEVRIMQALDHPHIVPVLDWGTGEAGELFLVMPLYRGGDLFGVLCDLMDGVPEVVARWTLQRRRKAFLDLAMAIEHAHALGILHRDLKPSNVLLDADYTVRLGDWGLAGPPGSATQDWLPARGTGHSDLLVGGTVGYMSPEQLSDIQRYVGVRSEVWSLGALLFELLVLRPLVRGVDEVDKARRTRGAGPLADAWVRQRLEELPLGLADVITCAIEREPEHRFASVGEMVEALGHVEWSAPQVRSFALGGLVERHREGTDAQPPERTRRASSG